MNHRKPIKSSGDLSRRHKGVFQCAEAEEKDKRKGERPNALGFNNWRSQLLKEGGEEFPTRNAKGRRINGDQAITAKPITVYGGEKATQPDWKKKRQNRAEREKKEGQD